MLLCIAVGYHGAVLVTRIANGDGFLTVVPGQGGAVGDASDAVHGPTTTAVGPEVTGGRVKVLAASALSAMPP